MERKERERDEKVRKERKKRRQDEYNAIINQSSIINHQSIMKPGPKARVPGALAMKERESSKNRDHGLGPGWREIHRL